MPRMESGDAGVFQPRAAAAAVVEAFIRTPGPAPPLPSPQLSGVRRLPVERGVAEASEADNGVDGESASIDGGDFRFRRARGASLVKFTGCVSERSDSE